MITAVSLNPSIDRTLEVDSFTVGGLNRVKGQTDVAAGKGANAALAAAALGAEAECVGFMFADGDKMFRDRLDANHVRCEFIMCDGHVRVNQKIFDRARGEITELNQSGVAVGAEKLNEMERLIARRHTDILILTGSLPPECPADIYARLCASGKASGARVIIDADGDRLKAGIAAHPDLIKPNRYELETLVGGKLNTLSEIARAARELIAGGVGIVAVSLGAEGALIVDGSGAWHTDGLRVDVKSTVAAGDSMVAGLAVGMAEHMALPEAFRLGAAAATARCATLPERMIDMRDVQACAEKLRVRRLSE